MRSAAEDISWIVDSRWGEVVGRLRSRPSEGVLCVCGGVGRGVGLPVPLGDPGTPALDDPASSFRMGERSSGWTGAGMGERTTSESASRKQLGAEGGLVTLYCGVAAGAPFGGYRGSAEVVGGAGALRCGAEVRRGLLRVRIDLDRRRFEDEEECGDCSSLRGVTNSDVKAPKAVQAKTMMAFLGSLRIVKSINTRRPYAR